MNSAPKFLKVSSYSSKSELGEDMLEDTDEALEDTDEACKKNSAISAKRNRGTPVTCNQIVYELNKIQFSILNTPEHISIQRITNLIHQIEELYGDSITYPLHDAIMLLEQNGRYDKRVSKLLSIMPGLLVNELSFKVNKKLQEKY
jgi:hypothetical protein